MATPAQSAGERVVTGLWNSEQREWLQALGHEVLMLAPLAAGAAVEPALGTMPDMATTAAAWPDSPLLRALVRAAGGRAPDAELMRLLPDPLTLRGNAAAKRALWPRLRALRGRGGR